MIVMNKFKFDNNKNAALI